MRYKIKFLIVILALTLSAACVGDRSVFEDILQGQQQQTTLNNDLSENVEVPVVNGMELEGRFRILEIYLDTDDAADYFNGRTISTELEAVEGSTGGVDWVSEDSLEEGESMEDLVAQPVIKIDDRNDYSRLVFHEDGSFALRYRFIDENKKQAQLGDLDTGTQSGNFVVNGEYMTFEATSKHPYGVMDLEETDVSYRIIVEGNTLILEADDQNRDVGEFVIIIAEKVVSKKKVKTEE